jgi:Bacterial SH3 domain
MRIARAIGSMPHLRRQLVPTGVVFSTSVEQPAQGVSSVNVKPTHADQTPLASSLALWVIRALIAGLVIVALIPNLILGVIFCAEYLLAELRERWRGMRIARAIGSMPHFGSTSLQRQRSRLSRGRLQGNVSTAIERPALEVPGANTKRGPADQTPLAPLLTLSVIRALVAGLIFVALIPNLTLGAIFWLGVINTSWSRPATQPPNESSVPAAQSAVPAPVLSSPTTLEATAGGDITFPIALDGTDGVPARSIIAIRGLPQGSKLSSGRPYDETEWNLKPDEIGDLHLVLPSNANGDAKLLLQLVAPDGAIIADAATVLKMPANSAANIPASNIETELAESQVSDERAQAAGESDAEGTLPNLDAASVKPGDPVPLPRRRLAQTSNDDANWITLTSVNLREGPTRSAPAIGVVAKDAKLHLIGRKRLWVQVTNPATSEEGWIYARHVATVR